MTIQRSRSGEDDGIENHLIHPPFWLVYPLEWPLDPEVAMAEAAFAIAPSTIVSRGTPSHVQDVVRITRRYAEENPRQRVVWFTDVTRWLDTHGQSWVSLGVEWERALQEIPELPILGLFLTINQRAYMHLINAARRHTVYYTDGTREDITEEERDAVHRALEQQLATDWPRYVQEMLASGRLTIT